MSLRPALLSALLRPRRAPHGTLALLVTVALLAVPVLAGDLVEWGQATNLSDKAGRSTGSALAENPISHDVQVVWMDDGIATWEEILGRRWSAATGRWLPAQNLSQSAEWERDGGPSLIFDEQGHGLLVWTRTYSAFQGAPEDGYDIMWRAWDGSTWSAPQVLLHGLSYLPGSPGTFHLILVERPASILLFICWGNSYRTAEYSAGAWGPVSNWITLDVDLAIIIGDDQGLLHAASLGANSNQSGYNKWFDDAYYLVYDGTTWTTPLNISSWDGVATDLGIAFDGQGRLHFLWSDVDSPYSDESLKSAIWERVYDGSTWSPNVEVTAYNDNQAVNGLALTTGLTGTLHLVWSEGLMLTDTHTGLDIYYQAGDGLTWEPEQKVFTSTTESRYPAVRSTRDGAVILWEEIATIPPPVPPDSEVFAARQIDTPPSPIRVFLPFIVK